MRHTVCKVKTIGQQLLLCKVGHAHILGDTTHTNMHVTCHRQLHQQQIGIGKVALTMQVRRRDAAITSKMPNDHCEGMGVLHVEGSQSMVSATLSLLEPYALQNSFVHVCIAELLP